MIAVAPTAVDCDVHHRDVRGDLVRFLRPPVMACGPQPKSRVGKLREGPLARVFEPTEASVAQMRRPLMQLGSLTRLIELDHDVSNACPHDGLVTDSLEYFRHPSPPHALDQMTKHAATAARTRVHFPLMEATTVARSGCDHARKETLKHRARNELRSMVNVRPHH